MIHIPSFSEMKKKPFIYFKREGYNFWFKNDWIQFDIEMRGKDLFEFTDEYQIGDEVIFEDDGSQGHDLSTIKL